MEIWSALVVGDTLVSVKKSGALWLLGGGAVEVEMLSIGK